MKFDSFMNFLYKGLCLITAAACVAGLIVSWCSEPLAASAESIVIPDWAQPLDNYTKTYEQRLHELNSSGAFQDTLSDPNISDSTKFYLLQGYALQEFDYRLAVELLADSIDGEFDYPVSVPVDVSGASGCYRSALDNLLHPVASFSFSSSGVSICTSDEFTVYLSIEDNSNGMLAFESYENITSNWVTKGLKVRPLGLAFGLSMTTSQSGEYFTNLPSYSSSSNVGQMLICTDIDRRANNFTLSRTAFASLFSGYPVQVGAFGSSVELPEGQMDISQPWEYYDNTLKPYLLEHVYNDLPDTIDVDDFLVFPVGYTPPEPTESATFPNGGITIDYNNYFTIDSSGVPVTDASGELVTDASGETVTETVYIVDTAPTDGIYNFNIPTLPAVEIPSGDFPAFLPGSDLAQAVPGFFSGITAFYTETGLDSIVPAFVAISAVIILVKVLL